MKKRFLLFLALPLLMFGVATATFSMNNREPAIAVHAEEVFVEETYTMVEDDATFILRLTSETNYTITATKAETTMTVSGVYIRNGNTVELYVDGELFDTVELDSENGTFSYIDEEEPDWQETEEEDEKFSTLKDLYEEALEEINKLKDDQFVSNLIATITGGLGSMLISCLFMFVNRDTMKKCLSALKLGETTLRDGIDRTKEAMDRNNIVSDQANKVIEKIEVLDEKYKEGIEKIEKFGADLDEYAKCHQEDIELLLEIICSCKELVANGTAEKLYAIYHKEK